MSDPIDQKSNEKAGGAAAQPAQAPSLVTTDDLYIELGNTVVRAIAAEKMAKMLGDRARSAMLAVKELQQSSAEATKKAQAQEQTAKMFESRGEATAAELKETKEELSRAKKELKELLASAQSAQRSLSESRENAENVIADLRREIAAMVPKAELDAALKELERLKAKPAAKKRKTKRAKE